MKTHAQEATYYGQVAYSQMRSVVGATGALHDVPWDKLPLSSQQFFIRVALAIRAAKHEDPVADLALYLRDRVSFVCSNHAKELYELGARVPALLTGASTAAEPSR